MTLSIAPFEDVDKTILEDLASDLSAPTIRVSLLSSIKIPYEAFNPGRKQFRGDAFLDAARCQPAERVLAVTGVDLYTDHLNFVFGLAEPGGKAAVISIHRLRLNDGAAKFRERLVKEAIHEIGHTLGLSHCDDTACVMYFSNSLADTDMKGRKCCPCCAGQVGGLL